MMTRDLCLFLTLPYIVVFYIKLALFQCLALHAQTHTHTHIHTNIASNTQHTTNAAAADFQSHLHVNLPLYRNESMRDTQRAALTSDQNGFSLKHKFLAAGSALNRNFWRRFVEGAVHLLACLCKGIAIAA